MTAQHEMGELALELWMGPSVVVPPDRIGLSRTRGCERLRVAVEVDRTVRGGSRAGITERAGCAGIVEGGRARPSMAADCDGDLVRAGHRARPEVDREPVLAKAPLWSDRRLGLQIVGDNGSLEQGVQLAGAARVVAVGDRARLLASGLFEQIPALFDSRCGVAEVARADHGRGDELGVRIAGDVTLLAAEAVRNGLVAVTGLRVDGRDHPVRRDALGDRTDAVRSLLEVLAEHLEQQRRRLLDRQGELGARERHHEREAVLHARVDELGARLLALPVDLGLGRARLVITAFEHAHELGSTLGAGHLQ